MVFVLTILSVVVTAHTLAAWREVRERETRWGFYALRDRLRWAAIEDPALLRTPVFERLDRAFTCDAANVDQISLWAIVPVFFFPSLRRRFREDMRQQETLWASPENEPLRHFREQGAELLAGLFLVRHPVLAAVAVLLLLFFSAGTKSLSYIGSAFVTGTTLRRIGVR